MSIETDMNQELRVLRMVKRVLTDIAKDTHTPPGMKHPLSDHTIMGIRDCLALISTRELEIQDSTKALARPRFIDQPNNNVVVALNPKKPKSPTPPNTKK